MAQLSVADLQETPSVYESTRNIGDVLVGEDAARLLMEASLSGNDTALQSLLSQPHWIKIMLEKPHCIYSENRPSQGPNDARQVTARRISNIERTFSAAAQNGHAVIVSILLAFATQQGTNVSDLITRSTINKVISGGHAAVFKIMASAEPDPINFQIGHGTRPLYEAVKRRQTDLVATLLELGADPLHPVEQSRDLATYNSSLMSLAAMAEGPHITKMLLEYGVPIANTGALHSAAHRGHLDTMRLLMQHGANVDEVLSNWANRTPMHFAASRGQVDAMKLLEHSGARSDLKDADGKTPAQLLEEHNTASPAKEAIKGYHRHEFDGSLGMHTKYIGEPRPETEEAWAHLFKHYNLRFTAEEMQKLNRTENPIELQNGGGFFGQLSAYHHLHCLSMLRQVLWHDFYNISIPNLRGHADHCINDIRQSLMCHADLSVVTFWWHPEMRKPMPNFHIDQTCVNWDALDAWAAKRSFSIFDQKTLVHPTLGLSFPMVDGEIQVHGGHDHDHKLNHTLDLPPVWPEAEGDPEDKGHSEGHHGEHS